tara:strand:- start:887 stop:2071 length:1185 start_codon:yes stop_codon:yes gene_type:complete
MIFQPIDDKADCIGIYADGTLFYEGFPSPLTRTWQYSASLHDENIEYAYLYGNGKTLEDLCPPVLTRDLKKAQKRLKAYMKSFQLAKVEMRDHCIFDLVPEDFLKEFCEIKNKITEHVFETHEKPEAYPHLDRVHQLLHQIRYQKLNLNNENCKELYYLSTNRKRANLLLNGAAYIDYNMFGTITGRLTTRQNSFPVLTVKKDFRRLLKPQNEWFLSLDYNAAEVRTFIALAGEEQPQEDVHEWHIKNLIDDELTREDAKIRFFAWLYNYDSDDDEFGKYHRDRLLQEWYHDDYIATPFGRKISVDTRKALNYLIQSTTADLVLDRAIALNTWLQDYKSFVSHIVHDEVVIDLSDDERHLVPDIKNIFSDNKLDKFLVNLTCGKNYYELQELKL